MIKSDTVTLVLLGRRGSGKSCCGNTILGRKGFQSFISTKPVTTECKKETESIQGRQITVIDTPDFFDDSLPDPKPHIDTCRSLAAEGPCVYLLVLQLGRFTEGEKKIVEQTEHMFGRDVTRRMIILFSYGDDLEGITIEDFLKNAQTELKALVKRCGNRYHVFNNRDTNNRRQVTELLNMVVGMLGRGEGGPVTQKPQLSVKNIGYVEKQEAQDRNNDSAVRRMEIPVNDSTYPVKRKLGMREGDDGSFEKQDTIAVTLVLLGRRGSGKSCCGNTILGREGFQSILSTKPVTTECQTQKVSIQGRQITVIDTPDFFDDSLPDPKPHIDTCRPLVAEGPCVYLLVLQLGRFTEGEKKIVEQTERMFGPDVTRRMIILFSYGDDLEGITTEEFLKNAQTELKALVEKCGNRYHVFNNRDTNNRRQVTELLNMVVGMLGRGEGGPVTQTPQLSVQKTRYVEKQEAQIRNNDSAVRRMEIEVNDSTYPVKRKMGMREGDDGSFEKRDTIGRVTGHVTLVLLGRRGSGKSCCGNTILGRKAFQSILSTKPVTTECKKQTESIQGRQITVIDTPDFFDDSLPDSKPHIDTCRPLVAEGPCVYLLVLQLGRFTEGEKKIVEQTESVFGRDVTRRMIILFSYGDDLEGITIQDFLKNAQTELKALVEKCGNRYHVFNNRDTRSDRQVTELLNMVDVMLDRGKGGPQLTDSVNGIESKAGMAEGDKDHLKMPRICMDNNESNAGNIMNKVMSDNTGNQQINGNYLGNAGSMKGNMVKRDNTDIQSTSVNVRDSRMGNDGGVPESQGEKARVNDNRHRVQKKPEMTGDYEAQGTASALGTTQGHNVRDPDRKRINIIDSANTSYVKRRAGEPREGRSVMQREDFNMQDCRRVGSRDTFTSIRLEVNQHDVYKKKNMRGAPGDPQQAQNKQKQVTEGVVRDGRKMQAQGSPVTRGEDSSAQRDGRNDKESTTMCKCVLF